MARIEMERLIPRPSSRFLLASCLHCGNKQIINDSAKTKIVCNVCGEALAVPQGGKAKILGKIESILD